MQKNNVPNAHRAASPLYGLFYTSTAIHPMTQADLESLLRVARRRNVQLSVTGLLTYAEKEAAGLLITTPPADSFWQYIEGSEAAVRSLFYDQIARDPRHTGIEVHEEDPAQHRLFPDWDMAFKPASEAELENIDSFLLKAQYP